MKLLDNPIMWCTKCQQETQYLSWNDLEGIPHYLCNTCGSSVDSLINDNNPPIVGKRYAFGIAEKVSQMAHGVYQVEFKDRPNIYALWLSEEHISSRDDLDITMMEYDRWIRKDNPIINRIDVGRSDYIVQHEPNDSLLGKRAFTPDGEQGFVSQVYNDGYFDIDIINEDDTEMSDDEIITVTINYNIQDDDIEICYIQTPQIMDVTPYGVVGAVTMVARGYVNVRFIDQGGYALWVYGYEKVILPDKVQNLFFGNWLSYDNAEKCFPQYNTTEISTEKYHPLS